MNDFRKMHILIIEDALYDFEQKQNHAKKKLTIKQQKAVLLNILSLL